jgi:hypothetical protein
VDLLEGSRHEVDGGLRFEPGGAPSSHVISIGSGRVEQVGDHVAGLVEHGVATGIHVGGRIQPGAPQPEGKEFALVEGSGREAGGDDSRRVAPIGRRFLLCIGKRTCRRGERVARSAGPGAPLRLGFQLGTKVSMTASAAAAAVID